MKKLKFVSILFIIVFIFSCKKKEPINNNYVQPQHYNFLPSDSGNYWIYERYSIDANGNETPQGIFDSCYVEKDTIINSFTYHKMIKSDFFASDNFILFRDSLNYTVNENGYILFSSTDTTNILSSYYYLYSSTDTVALINLKMTDNKQNTITPAGVFNTINAQRTFNYFPNYAINGTTKKMNQKYADQIGLIYETLVIFTTTKNYIDRRLVRFHLEL